VTPALGPPQVPQIQTAYPHLLSEDTIVWTRWLEHNRHRITGVWYDVHVGEPVAVPAGLHPGVAVDALAITRKRIDVVAKAGPEIWVIELKPFANYTSLGQALAYSRLFAQEYHAGAPVTPMVICCEVDPDLVDDFRRLGVRYEEVGYPPYTI
jgi:hypothetical protein